MVRRPTAVIDNTHPALRRSFHPVCRSSDVAPGALSRVTLLGEDWIRRKLDAPEGFGAGGAPTALA